MAAKTVIKKTGKKNRFIDLKKLVPLYIMLFPAFVLTLIFNYYPMYGAQIAFKDFKIKEVHGLG